MKFAYNTDATAAGADMVIKKVILDLVPRLVPSNVWKIHLVKAMGEKNS